MDNFKETYFPVWAACWNFHKNFSQVQDDDDYWNGVVDGAEAVSAKFKNTEQETFAKNLILAISSELERVSKARQQSEREVAN